MIHDHLLSSVLPSHFDLLLYPMAGTNILFVIKIVTSFSLVVFFNQREGFVVSDFGL